MAQKQNSGFLLQATILATAGLIVRFVGFLYRIPMQNILMDEGTGVYGQAYNVYLLFFVISSAGIPAAVSKMVAARVALNEYHNAHTVFKAAMLFSGSLGFISMCILFFGADYFAVLFNSVHVAYSIQALAPTVFIVTMLAAYRGYFQGLGNAVPTAVSQVVEQLINAIATIVLVYILIDEGIAMASAGGTAGTGIGAVFGLVVMAYIYYLGRGRIKRNIRKNKGMQKEPFGKIIVELIKTTVPIIAGTSIFGITNIIDMQMAMNILQYTGHTYMEALRLFGQFSGKYVVITTLPVSIAMAMSTALIPSLSGSTAVGDTQNTKNKIDMALRMTILITMPAAVGIGVMADQILLFLFPNNPDGGVLLQVGAASILFMSLYQIGTGVLQGMGKLMVPIIAATIGATIKIAVNFFLLSSPEINILALVISTTICYAIASVINLSVVYRSAKLKLQLGTVFVKPLICAIVMGMVCYVAYFAAFFVTGMNSVSLLVAISLSIFSYFTSMIMIRGITQRDLIVFPSGEKIMRLLDRLGVSYKD